MIKLKSLLKESSISPVLTNNVNGYKIDIYLENEKFYSKINHSRYGKRTFKTPEKAMEYAITKLLPIRQQVDNRPKSPTLDFQSNIAHNYFGDVDKRGF